MNLSGLNRSKTPPRVYRAPSPRVGTRSPFRNVYQNKDIASSDSILNEMTSTFDDKVLTIVRRRSEQIMSRYVRLNYLGKEDTTILEGCRSQCEAFMNNVENCLRAAARRDESMSQSTVRRAFEQWNICNELSSQITLVLEGKGKRRPVTPPRFNTPQRSYADRPTHNSDIDELKSLQRLRNVDRETAARIYDLCVAIYGSEKGHTEFVSWLSLIPHSAIQILADAVL